MQISLDEARQLILKSQLLDGHTKSANGKKGIIQIFDQLGYVQIDTIHVIQRAHHHTLFTRLDDYEENILHDLQARERSIFEYWGHAMSYLPMSDYRFYLPRMQNFYTPKSKWNQQKLEQAGHLLEPVLKRIQEEGPLCAKDFSTDKQKGSSWWDWKPAKVALELLFWRGELMISERRKFQKFYDLTERVLPAGMDLSLPSSKEIARFLVRRALKAMGVANEKEIQKFLQPEAGRDSDLRIVEKNEITDTIQELIEAKEIVTIEIDGLKDSLNYGFADVISGYEAANQSEKEIFFLSPFDNLIIQRARLKRLFDFDYTLECYLPEAKRKHGYFVLPILFGEHFVGRMDVKAERKTNTLIINSLTFESGYEPTDSFLLRFSDKLRTFAQFNGCGKIKLKQEYSYPLKSKIQHFIEQI